MEYSKIDITREWLDEDVFSLNQLQIDDQIKDSWSNGS